MCAKLTFKSWDKLDQAIQGWCGTSLVHPDFLMLLQTLKQAWVAFDKLAMVAGHKNPGKTHRCAKITFRSWDKLDQAIQGWCGTSLVHPDFVRLLQTLNQAWVAS